MWIVWIEDCGGMDIYCGGTINMNMSMNINMIIISILCSDR